MIYISAKVIFNLALENINKKISGSIVFLFIFCLNCTLKFRLSRHERPPIPESPDSIDATSTEPSTCCQSKDKTSTTPSADEQNADVTTRQLKTTAKAKTCGSNVSANSYAANRNVAEGLMDIALLSANANQLRFLITYNHEASTYYVSLGLIVLSLFMQVAVGITLIFKRRLKNCHDRQYTRTNELLIAGVFIITVVNVLLAAFTTTDEH